MFPFLSVSLGKHLYFKSASAVAMGLGGDGSTWPKLGIFSHIVEFPHEHFFVPNGGRLNEPDQVISMQHLYGRAGVETLHVGFVISSNRTESQPIWRAS